MYPVPVSEDVIGEDLLGAGGQEGDEVCQGQGHQVAVRRCVQRLRVPAKKASF
jgi:hypothetical protein